MNKIHIRDEVDEIGQFQFEQIVQADHANRMIIPVHYRQKADVFFNQNDGSLRRVVFSSIEITFRFM